MTLIVFSGLIMLAAFLGGTLGALTGLGGGVIIIPTLVLLFHIPIHYAMGASLISVLATSNGAATAYVRQGYTNLRIGLLLEVTAVTGALVGALLIAWVSPRFLAIIFSLVLFISAYLTIKRTEQADPIKPSHKIAQKLRLDGTYYSHGTAQTYHVQSVPFAMMIIGIAGLLSGLLGIGSGALKVLAMDHGLKLPYKISTATSNFMIGITAACGAGIYLKQGYIQSALIAPVLIGAFFGAMYGTRLMTLLNVSKLRIIFSVTICFIGIQMLYNAIAGSI